jgi:arylsulfatase A-like enzyme
VAFSRVIPVLVFCAALCAGSAYTQTAVSAPAKKPNIVVFMTDDQTVESLRVMPHVQRLLAERGTTFENSFASFALCCPSRATFLTGQYAHNHHVLGNQPPSGGYDKLDGSSTLPLWLQKAGYATAHVGKYLNGYGLARPREVPPGWDEWYAPIGATTYNYYGYRLNENGSLVRYGSATPSYRTDVDARIAADVVRRRSASDAPLFLSVAFLAPHTGGPIGADRALGTALPARRHRGRFAFELLPTPASFDEADVSDKPLAIRKRRRLSLADVSLAVQRYRLRLESLLAVDEAVAKVVAELERSGELANTLIVFTSDNGYFQGEHRIKTGKVDLYDSSTRIPLVIRGPGVPAGVSLPHAVMNVDLAPTIVEAAGATAGLRMDGRSLWPILRDRGIFWARDILHEGPGSSPDTREFTALRTPRWLYAEHVTGERELYDLEQDPDELQSLHGDPALQVTRDQLAARLAALRDCTAEDCRRGAAVGIAVRRDGACPGAAADVEVTGADAGAVRSARFVLDREYLVTDTEAPYALRVPLASAPSQLRVRAVLADGRQLTRDRILEACR